MSDDIAHDLRTPLGRLRQRLEVALANSEGGGRSAQIESAIEQVDAILATFAGLLRISQIEAQRPRDGFEVVPMSDLLANIADAYEAEAESTGRRIETMIAEDLAADGDRVLLEQLFVNLIENGLRHTSVGSTVWVSGHRRMARVVIRISDDGPGIPAEMRAAVFERFSRLETSRSSPGFGLGLSLARAISVYHGIEMTLRDNCPGLVVELAFPPPALLPAR